jgi:hypothetical protein
MKVQLLAVAALVLAMQGCVTVAESKRLYAQGRIDAFTDLVELQNRASVLEGCKDLVKRAFPETNPQGIEQINQRLTMAVNAPVVVPTPEPTPTPKPTKAKKGK